MDFKHLRSFCVLAETLHFGRAAGRLHIVQPALSNHIKQLEQELSCRLFERSRHHVSLTSAGHHFLREAQQILQHVSDTIENTRHIATGTIGTLHIGFVSSAIPAVLAEAIRRFTKRSPHVEIELTEMSSGTQLAAIAEHNLDLGFVRMPIYHEHLQIRAIAREHFEAIMSDDHHLADQTRLNPADLNEETIFVLARDNAPGFHDALLGAFHQSGMIPRRIKYIREFSTAIQLASVNLGVAIVPRFAAYSTPGNVTRLRLDLGENFSEIGIVHATPVPPLLQHFLDIVEETRLSQAKLRSAEL